MFVVGLGNPGREYQGTRHNVGFETVEELAERHRFPPWKRFEGAEVARGRIAGQEVMLVKPTTYMNRSGNAVGVVMRYFRGEPEEVIVVHDDLDFDPGQVRVKVGGGHGGHNGLKSITEHIGNAFARVRIGIGKPPAHWEGADWVLAAFDATTRRIMDETIGKASDAVEMMLEKGVQKAMNYFNKRPKDPKEDREEKEEKEEEKEDDTSS